MIGISDYVAFSGDYLTSSSFSCFSGDSSNFHLLNDVSFKHNLELLLSPESTLAFILLLIQEVAKQRLLSPFVDKGYVPYAKNRVQLLGLHTDPLRQIRDHISVTDSSFSYGDVVSLAKSLYSTDEYVHPVITRYISEFLFIMRTLNVDDFLSTLIKTRNLGFPNHLRLFISRPTQTLVRGILSFYGDSDLCESDTPSLSFYISCLYIYDYSLSVPDRVNLITRINSMDIHYVLGRPVLLLFVCSFYDDPSSLSQYFVYCLNHLSTKDPLVVALFNNLQKAVLLSNNLPEEYSIPFGKISERINDFHFSGVNYGSVDLSSFYQPGVLDKPSYLESLSVWKLSVRTVWGFTHRENSSITLNSLPLIVVAKDRTLKGGDANSFFNSRIISTLSLTLITDLFLSLTHPKNALTFRGNFDLQEIFFSCRGAILRAAKDYHFNSFVFADSASVLSMRIEILFRMLLDKLNLRTSTVKKNEYQYVSMTDSVKSLTNLELNSSSDPHGLLHEFKEILPFISYFLLGDVPGKTGFSPSWGVRNMVAHGFMLENIDFSTVCVQFFISLYLLHLLLIV